LFVNRYAGKTAARKLDMDEDLVGQYIASIKQLKKRYRLEGEIGVSLLSNIPDLVHVREAEADPAGERHAVLKALGVALAKLERSREREGGQLRVDMESQIRHLSQIAGLLEARVAENPVRFPKSLAEGQNGSAAERDTIDSATLQLKGDVNEEVVRLKTHVAVLTKVIREREPVGKKIDFMLQEVNRELNTISSKVPYLPVVQLVLQGKERAEKIREQAQNVE
jgi:uncharacterized protein (TIGR00255 family)